jgi:hypothetical protein
MERQVNYAAQPSTFLVMRVFHPVGTETPSFCWQSTAKVHENHTRKFSIPRWGTGKATNCKILHSPNRNFCFVTAERSKKFFPQQKYFFMFPIHSQADKLCCNCNYFDKSDRWEGGKFSRPFWVVIANFKSTQKRQRLFRNFRKQIVIEHKIFAKDKFTFPVDKVVFCCFRP